MPHAPRLMTRPAAGVTAAFAVVVALAAAAQQTAVKKVPNQDGSYREFHYDTATGQLTNIGHFSPDGKLEAFTDVVDRYENGAPSKTYTRYEDSGKKIGHAYMNFDASGHQTGATIARVDANGTITQSVDVESIYDPQGRLTTKSERYYDGSDKQTGGTQYTVNYRDAADTQGKVSIQYWRPDLKTWTAPVPAQPQPPNVANMVLVGRTEGANGSERYMMAGGIAPPPAGDAPSIPVSTITSDQLLFDSMTPSAGFPNVPGGVIAAGDVAFVVGADGGGPAVDDGPQDFLAAEHICSGGDRTHAHASPPQSSSGSGPVDFSMSFVATGTPSGNAFNIHVVNHQAVRRPIIPEGLLLQAVRGRGEPVKARPGEASHVEPAVAFCARFEKPPPPAGTLYRVADRAAQRRAMPLRAVLSAGRRLAERGQLHPDSNPEAYANFIRQWAIWTRQHNWSAEQFAQAVVDRTKENFRVLNRGWTGDAESTLRNAIPGRWRDVSAVLAEADALVKAGAPGPAVR
jgi:hypothetical protein